MGQEGGGTEAEGEAAVRAAMRKGHRRRSLAHHGSASTEGPTNPRCATCGKRVDDASTAGTGAGSAVRAWDVGRRGTVPYTGGDDIRSHDSGTLPSLPSGASEGSGSDSEFPHGSRARAGAPASGLPRRLLTFCSAACRQFFDVTRQRGFDIKVDGKGRRQLSERKIDKVLLAGTTEQDHAEEAGLAPGQVSRPRPRIRGTSSRRLLSDLADEAAEHGVRDGDPIDRGRRRSSAGLGGGQWGGLDVERQARSHTVGSGARGASLGGASSRSDSRGQWVQGQGHLVAGAGEGQGGEAKARAGVGEGAQPSEAGTRLPYNAVEYDDIDTPSFGPAAFTRIALRLLAASTSMEPQRALALGLTTGPQLVGGAAGLLGTGLGSAPIVGLGESQTTTISIRAPVTSAQNAAVASHAPAGVDRPPPPGSLRIEPSSNVAFGRQRRDDQLLEEAKRQGELRAYRQFMAQGGNNGGILRLFTGWSGSSGQGGGLIGAGGVSGIRAEVVLKTGFLWKRGGHRGGRKTWKRRFFALKDETLHYYGLSSSTLLGAMPLVGHGDGGGMDGDISNETYLATASVIQGTEADSLGLPSSLTPFLFVVVTPDRSLFLCAESSKQRVAWMESVRQLVDTHQRRQHEFRSRSAPGGRSPVSHLSTRRAIVTIGDVVQKRDPRRRSTFGIGGDGMPPGMARSKSAPYAQGHAQQPGDLQPIVESNEAGSYMGSIAETAGNDPRLTDRRPSVLSRKSPTGSSAPKGDFYVDGPIARADSGTPLASTAFERVTTTGTDHSPAQLPASSSELRRSAIAPLSNMGSPKQLEGLIPGSPRSAGGRDHGTPEGVKSMDGSGPTSGCPLYDETGSRDGGLLGPVRADSGDRGSRIEHRGSGVQRVVSASRKSLTQHGTTMSGLVAWELSEDEVEVTERIGAGNFGEVFRGRLWGSDVAVKLMRATEVTSKEVESLQDEVDILAQLRHPNVVLYMGASTTPPNIFIVTEWCERGSLHDMLYDPTQPISAASRINMALQTAQGMAYLHSRRRGIIHRDLKSQNLLVSRDMVVKVADFGLTVIKKQQRQAGGAGGSSSVHGVVGAGEDTGSSSPMKAFAGGSIAGTGTRGTANSSGNIVGVMGTPQFMAPEVLEGERYGGQVDVYAFGVVMCELLSRVLPFSDRYKRFDFIDAVLEEGAVPSVPAWCRPAEQIMGTSPVPQLTELTSDLHTRSHDHWLSDLRQRNIGESGEGVVARYASSDRSLRKNSLDGIALDSMTGVLGTVHVINTNDEASSVTASAVPPSTPPGIEASADGLEPVDWSVRPPSRRVSIVDAFQVPAMPSPGGEPISPNRSQKAGDRRNRVAQLLSSGPVTPSVPPLTPSTPPQRAARSAMSSADVGTSKQRRRDASNEDSLPVPAMLLQHWQDDIMFGQLVLQCSKALPMLQPSGSRADGGVGDGSPQLPRVRLNSTGTDGEGGTESALSMPLQPEEGSMSPRTRPLARNRPESKLSGPSGPGGSCIVSLPRRHEDRVKQMRDFRDDPYLPGSAEDAAAVLREQGLPVQPGALLPGRVEEWVSTPASTAAALLQIITESLNRNPRARPSFDDLVEALHQLMSTTQRDFFQQLEVPRIREELTYGSVGVRQRAAREIRHLAAAAAFAEGAGTSSLPVPALTSAAVTGAYCGRHIDEWMLRVGVQPFLGRRRTLTGGSESEGGERESIGARTPQASSGRPARFESTRTMDSDVEAPGQRGLMHSASAASIGSGFSNGFGSGFGGLLGVHRSGVSNARPPFLPFSRTDGGRAVRADAPVSSVVPAGGSQISTADVAMIRDSAAELAAGLMGAARLDDIALRLCLGIPLGFDKTTLLIDTTGSGTEGASDACSGSTLGHAVATSRKSMEWPCVCPKDISDDRGKVMEAAAESIASCLHALDALIGSAGTTMAKSLAHATAGRLAHCASTVLILKTICGPLSRACKVASQMDNDADDDVDETGSGPSKDGKATEKKLSRAERFRAKMQAKRKAKQSTVAPLPAQLGDDSAVTVARSLLHFLWHFAPGHRGLLIKTVAQAISFSSGIASAADAFVQSAGGKQSGARPSIDSGATGLMRRARLKATKAIAQLNGMGDGEEATVTGATEADALTGLPGLEYYVSREVLR